MNRRDEIKAGLMLLTKAQNRQFRVFFGQGNVAASTEYVIDNMLESKLDAAVSTVRASIKKLQEK